MRLTGGASDSDDDDVLSCAMRCKTLHEMLFVTYKVNDKLVWYKLIARKKVNLAFDSE